MSGIILARQLKSGEATLFYKFITMAFVPLHLHMPGQIGWNCRREGISFLFSHLGITCSFTFEEHSAVLPIDFEVHMLPTENVQGTLTLLASKLDTDSFLF